MQGFFQLFAQGWGGGAKRDCMDYCGASTYPCAKHVANYGGPGACSPEKFWFWTFY